MSDRFTLWRRLLLVWAVPLGVCLVALLGLVVYRSTFAGKVEVLERRQVEAAADLERLRGDRSELAEFLRVVAAGTTGIGDLYRFQFATEAERFTDSVYELKQLATRAGLAPSQLSYPRSELPSGDLVERSFQFSVSGTYEQLRTFVNLLELSDHFLVLEQVGLSQSDDTGSRRSPTLSISLAVSTIFSRAEALEARARRAAP